MAPCSRLVPLLARLCWVVAMLGAAPARATAQEVVFVTRHAERVDASADSALSAAGLARAERLATLLKDAGITNVITTDLQRTMQTAAPLAAARHITPSALEAGDQDVLLAAIRGAGPQARLLVVGHSNTVPPLLHELGIAEPIHITDAEYDNLFVVFFRNRNAPLLVRLKY